MATVNPSAFDPKPFFVTSSGAPAVGYKLFTYLGGSTSTKVNTYTDATGSVADVNPIILNALGQTPNGYFWTQGQAHKVVLAPSTDTDPPTTPIFTVDNLYGINDPVNAPANSEWVLFAGAPTFVSTVSFTLAGNQTSIFQVGRRVRTTNTAGTIYSTITASVFTTLTTITVVNDSGVLDSGLSAVSYGLLAKQNPSIPALPAQINPFTTTGSATAYVGVPLSPITAYAANQSFFVTFHTASGAAPTLQISGIATPPNLVKQLGDGTYANIAANDFPTRHRSQVTLLSATQALVETIPVGVYAATQAQQETGTSLTTLVTPGRQQYHPSAAKAWVIVNTAGAIQASYNVASVTDTGTGVITPIWDVDFSSPAYSIVGQAISTPGGTAATTFVTHVNNTLAAGQAVLTCVNMSTFLATDPNFWSVAAYGDQA